MILSKHSPTPTPGIQSPSSSSSSSVAAASLFCQSCEKFSQSLQLQPSFLNALCNWSVALASICSSYSTPPPPVPSASLPAPISLDSNSDEIRSRLSEYIGQFFDGVERFLENNTLISDLFIQHTLTRSVSAIISTLNSNTQPNSKTRYTHLLSKLQTLHKNTTRPTTTPTVTMTTPQQQWDNLISLDNEQQNSLTWRDYDNNNNNGSANSMTDLTQFSVIQSLGANKPRFDKVNQHFSLYI